MTTTSATVPQYGGTFTGMQLADFRTFDIISDLGGGANRALTYERIWDGDWTKGPAGGYGTSETLWDGVMYIWKLKTGRLAESYTWTADFDKKTVTTVIKVRQGVHWALNPNSAASKLVGGREVTADDIVYNLDQRMNNPKSMCYQLTPISQGMHAQKTGPWEVTLVLPLDQWLSTIMKIVDDGLIYPREIPEKYGDMNDWRNSCGTGPFMVVDYVSNSSLTLVRNPNYWMKDPIGPGKGNQLPYLDSFKWLIIPDVSTQLSAMRTAKVDWIGNLAPEDANDMKKISVLKQGKQQPTGSMVLFMRTDKAPFNDVRVRQAMFMALDWQTMNNNLYYGQAYIISFPYWYVKGYEDLYMDLNSPDLPDNCKELFTYHPDKAKKLLADAGYPTGLKTNLIMGNTVAEIDYYTIVKEYWSKVGIDLTLDPRDTTALYPIQRTMDFPALITEGQAPPGTYPEQAHYTGPTYVNLSQIHDPKVDEAAEKARVACLKGDDAAAMKITRAVLPYLIEQCYVMGPVRYAMADFWWPWVKGYSGEVNTGQNDNYSFLRWIWIDQALKKSMGY